MTTGGSDPEGSRSFAVLPTARGTQVGQVRVADDAIEVEMRGLSVTMPRATTHARRLPDDPTPGGPDHDALDETRWRYTTASTGIVELTTPPMVKGWVGVAVVSRQVSVSVLRLSLDDPDGFVDWVEGRGERAE